MIKLLKKIFSFHKKPLTLEQYVNQRLTKGDTNEQIQKDLLNDLEKGGSIFGNFKEAYKPTFENSKRRFGDPVKINGEIAYKWSALNLPKYPSCPDCLERDGQIKTMKEWEKVGLPKTGKTRCKNDCKCILIIETLPLETSTLKEK